MNILNERVLVLNKSWHPSSVVTLRKAIILLCKEHADILHPKHETVYSYTWEQWLDLNPGEDKLYINSAKKHIKIPEVIVLYEYDRLPQQRMNFTRKGCFSRDHHTCMYCGGQDNLNVDHVIPKSQGGKSNWENCVVACLKCNSRKANRTPEQANMSFYKKDFKPYKPKFSMFKTDVESKPSWRYFLK